LIDFIGGRPGKFQIYLLPTIFSFLGSGSQNQKIMVVDGVKWPFLKIEIFKMD
jgi:hypothetical protein